MYPCSKYWTVTSTLVTLEHSRKQQNVGNTDATIGCSLKQPKITQTLLISSVTKTTLNIMTLVAQKKY